MMRMSAILLFAALLPFSAACSTGTDAGTDAVGDNSETAGPTAVEDGPVLFDSFASDLGLDQQWQGDLEGIVERGYLRALVTYSDVNYFLDGAKQSGIVYEALKEFETFLNKRLGKDAFKLHVLILPVGRDELIPALAEGLGDIAAASLTITEERKELVDFSSPTAKGVSEVIATGTSSQPIKTPADVAGLEVHVRPSSSYRESLDALNRMLEGDGLEPVKIVDAPEYLEADDLLELVHAGAIPATVVDSYLADFWGQVYTNVTFHRDVPVVRDREIGWAVRKNTPALMEQIDAFVKQHKAGTLYGNILINRYLKDSSRIENPRAKADQERFEKAWPLFQKYGEMYDFEPLFLTAVAYQESKLNQNTRSRAGAVGIMQIKPSTAADPNIGIHDISTMENNIHAGTKYLAFLRERYFSAPEVDEFNRYYLTLAAYNAGPGNIRKMRSRAPSMGLDPNRWFGEVEVVTARHVGREPVNYVSNIAKYFYAFQLSAAQLELKEDGQ